MTYTSLHVDQDKARQKLNSALAAAKQVATPQSKYASDIGPVILGSHLTYRYTLITSLLAKAVEPRVNALALQAGADFDNAFDARSLCHAVIVPFERAQLQGRLGRSNEPYLNKPARHKALSTDNAVRRGSDTRTLQRCISILTRCTGSEADVALADAIRFTLQRPVISDQVVRVDGDESLHESLSTFGETIITESHEGETCALLAGLAFFLLSTMSKEELEIRVHPVNQSGASSKEVLDVDVYVSEKLTYSAEVKDKPFTKQDLEHAANKVRAAGFDKMFFILGPRARQEDEGNLEVEVGSSTGVGISTISASQFFNVAHGLSIDTLDGATVWQQIVDICTTARFKQSTITFVQGVAREVGLIE
jgi:hypothetical protein